MNAGNYYRLLADPDAIDRWFLDSPINENGDEVDPRDFTIGKEFEGSAGLCVPAGNNGFEVDLNFAAFDMIVVPAIVNDELEKLPNTKLQRIPIQIEGTERQFEILNALDLVDCIDEDKSDYTKWTEQDHRSDLAGGYRMFTRLKIDPNRAAGHHLFRLQHWPIALVASEEAREVLEGLSVSGIAFQHLC